MLQDGHLEWKRGEGTKGRNVHCDKGMEVIVCWQGRRTMRREERLTKEKGSEGRQEKQTKGRDRKALKRPSMTP